MNCELNLSCCMISGAEAHRIRGALESVRGLASEIIVVLNEEVADGTDLIAKEYGAKVYREPWKGHIAQKNSAAEKASQPWILGLDADEVVSEELRAEIIRTLRDPSKTSAFSAFEFPRLTRLEGRWIRHGDWYPDRQLRLWKRGQARWGGINPHDHLQVDGKIGRLKSDLLHYTSEGLDQMIAKIAPYSQAFVQNFHDSGKRPSILDLGFRPFYRFFRGYVLKLGFLDGWQGYFIAWIAGFAAAVRYSKTFIPPKSDKENTPS